MWESRGMGGAQRSEMVRKAEGRSQKAEGRRQKAVDRG